MKKKNHLIYEDERYLNRNNVGILGKIDNYYRDLDYRHLVDLLKNKDSVLDLGCGSGEFLSRLKNKNLYGIDISKLAISKAKNRLKRVVLEVGDIDNLKLKKESFEAITCFHVLEHLRSPEKTIKRIYEILIKGGVFVIRIPNVNSWEAKVSQKNWFHYDYPYHKHFYSDKTIKTIFVKSGFKIKKIKYDLFEYRQTFLYSLMQFLGIRKIGYRTKLFLIPLQLIFIPLSFFIAKFFKNSGTIEVIATK